MSDGGDDDITIKGAKSPGKSSKDRRMIPFKVLDGGKKGPLGTGKDKVKKADQADFFADRSVKKSKSAKKAAFASQALKNPISDDALDAIINTLAIEEGNLLFEQKEAEKEGVLDLEISDRRVKILKSAADTILKRRAQISKKSIDLNGPQFRKVLGSLVDLFQIAMESCSVPAVKSEDILTALAEKMDDWEVRMTHELHGE